MTTVSRHSQKKKNQLFKTRYQWLISHCLVLHTLLHPWYICFNNKKKTLRKEKHFERLFSYSFKWPLLCTFRDSCVSLSLTLGLPQAFRVCCCFQGLVRSFIGAPVLWEPSSDSAPLALGISLPLSTRATPMPRVTLALGWAQLGQEWGEGSFWRLLMGTWAWLYQAPPWPLQLKQLRKKQHFPPSLSLTAPNWSWALVKVWLSFNLLKVSLEKRWGKFSFQEQNLVAEPCGFM